jgi:antirestriction protein ArdC
MESNVLSQKPYDIHRTITEKIVETIESGPGTYEMPWHRSGRGVGRPINARTGNAYRGVNFLSLWVDALKRGYPNGYWASYLQWQELGAQVQQGERGSLIVFYRQLEADEDEEERPRYVARGSMVFNAVQVKGWQAPEPPRTNLVERVEEAERVVAKTGANIREGHYDLACYDIALDQIDMPARRLFKGTATCTPTESFYATLFHELTHWTGHPSRLGRDLKNRFGDKGYAIEELVAELGSAFLAVDVGIATEPRPDHAAYVADWLRVVKADPRALPTAAAKASAAAEYVLSIDFSKGRS